MTGGKVGAREAATDGRAFSMVVGPLARWPVRLLLVLYSDEASEEPMWPFQGRRPGSVVMSGRLGFVFGGGRVAVEAASAKVATISRDVRQRSLTATRPVAGRTLT